MNRNLVIVLAVTVVFSAIALIPKGFSQWDTKLDYLVDESGKSIEINITTPVYVTSVPLEVYDAGGSQVLQREIDSYFTKRAESTRFNRFILNVPLPESTPVRVVLFPGTTMERSYILTSPQVEVDLDEGRARAYLEENSILNLTMVNGDTAAEYSLVSAIEGWHSLDIGSLPDKLMQPGSTLYFTITLPGGLSTTVTRYVPQVFVDAGTGYTNIKGRYMVLWHNKDMYRSLRVYIIYSYYPLVPVYHIPGHLTGGYFTKNTILQNIHLLVQE
jgi:hypothetical protein